MAAIFPKKLKTKKLFFWEVENNNIHLHFKFNEIQQTVSELEGFKEIRIAN